MVSEEDSSGVERFLASHGPFEKPPAFRCGDGIGDWRVLAFLGRGATSEVYVDRRHLACFPLSLVVFHEPAVIGFATLVLKKSRPCRVR